MLSKIKTVEWLERVKLRKLYGMKKFWIDFENDCVLLKNILSLICSERKHNVGYDNVTVSHVVKDIHGLTWLFSRAVSG